MATSSITAGTTRTQAGATPLTDQINRVDTSTPTSGVGDGVILPIVLAGTNEIVVINNTPNAIQLYGFGHDTINGVAGATGVGIAPGVMVFAMLASPGNWQAMGGPTPTTTINGSNGGGGGTDVDITSIGITSTGNTLTVTGSPLTANGSIELEVARPLPAPGTDGQVLTSSGGVWAPATPNVLSAPMTVLDKFGGGFSITNTTSETQAHLTLVPANTMSAHGGLMIISRWTITNNADTKNLHIRLNGITGTDFMGWSQTAQNTIEVMTLIQNRGVTNQQIGARLNNSFGASTSSFSLGNQDTTAALNLVFSGQPTSTADTITLESALVLTF